MFCMDCGYRFLSQAAICPECKALQPSYDGSQLEFSEGLQSRVKVETPTDVKETNNEATYAPTGAKGGRSLVECSSCEKSMAKTAKTCPHCGALNDWVHPKIKQFLANISTVSAPRRFQCWNSSTEIWGESPERSFAIVVWPLTIGAWFFLGTVLMNALGNPRGSFILTAIITLPFGFLASWLLKSNAVAFKANLETGVWSSNDDDFWASVRTALKV